MRAGHALRRAKRSLVLLPLSRIPSKSSPPRPRRHHAAKAGAKVRNPRASSKLCGGFFRDGRKVFAFLDKTAAGEGAEGAEGAEGVKGVKGVKALSATLRAGGKTRPPLKAGGYFPRPYKCRGNTLHTLHAGPGRRRNARRINEIGA